MLTQLISLTRKSTSSAVQNSQHPSQEASQRLPQQTVKQKFFFKSPRASAVVGLLACVAFLVPTTVQAEVDPAGWVGANIGMTIPNADNSTTRPLYGLTAGAKLGSEWGLGAYYLTSQKDEDVLGVTQKFNFDLYGIEFTYHFEGEARGVYFGGRVGTSKVTRGQTAGTLSTSPGHFGVVAGYNHFLGDHFSLGGDVGFTSISESSCTPAAGSPSVTIASFTMLNFMASAKFWF